MFQEAQESKWEASDAFVTHYVTITTQLCPDSVRVYDWNIFTWESILNCIYLLSNQKFLCVNYNSKILVFPADLGQLKELKQLVLNGLCLLNDPPPNICRTSTTCMSYLKSRFLKQGKLYHMNLILLRKM